MRLGLACTMLCVASTAHADKASGTWTGHVDLRGNYYWESSTRVVAPTAGVALEAPNGVRVRAAYLVDSITSASQAAGVIEDIRFTEIRHEGTVGAGYELELGDHANLDLDASFRVSREPDYVSLGGGLSSRLSFADRATVLSVSLFVLHDQINQVFRAGAGVRPNPMGGTSAGGFDESFNALALIVGWEQLLAENAYFQVGYQYGWMDGFLANAYRRVQVGELFRPENHPETRHRHTLSGRLAYHIRPTRTSVHLLYRAYYDSWRIAAITPEVRIYQQLARWTHARISYRHYRQTRSEFYQEEYDPSLTEDALVTADPKMSAFRADLLGFQLRMQLGFLEGTALSGLSETSLDLNFDYLWRTNRFGNGVIASVGLRAPF